MAKLYNLARMTTATTGTGTMTLGSAVSGFLTFAQAGAVDGDVVYYAIQDGANSEIGYGTYTSSGTTLSRTTVLNSTNSGSAISLSGSAQVFISPPATAWRETLTAARTYYVRTDGSDSNNGLANTAGGAFLTIQQAINTVAALDTAIYNVTISVGAGTFTATNTLKDPVGAGNVTISGAGSGSTTVSVTSNNCFFAQTSVKYTISAMTLTTTTSGRGLYAYLNSFISIGSDIVFGACPTAHMEANTDSTISSIYSYSVTGAAAYHWRGDNGARFLAAGITITTTGTMAYSYFCIMQNMSFARVNANTFTGGTITGTRYYASGNSEIYTNGGGASYFPGNVAGSTASGGQYI